MNSHIYTLPDNKNPLADKRHGIERAAYVVEDAIHDIKHLANLLFTHLESLELTPELKTALSAAKQIERRAGDAIQAYNRTAELDDA